MKKCSKCGETKPESAFSVNQSQCKSCRSATQRAWRERNPGREDESNRKWREKNSDRLKSKATKWQKENPTKVIETSWRSGGIDLSWEGYLMLLEQQEFSCAICGEKHTEGKKLQVDHCHSTGKIRGLLCHRCNKGLGFFRDSADSLNRAIDYLL